MTRVAAIGEAMIELAIAGQNAQLGVAGDTLNTAIYLKRAAPEVAVDYVTCLGDDPFSDQIEAFIQAQGIGTSHCTRRPGRSPGLYAITTTETGERSFTYWRSASAARDVFQTAQGYDFSALEAYDLIYLSGISVAILPHDVRMALLDWLATTPVRLAYDSNYRPRLWEDTDTARTVTEAFWRRADICLPSIDDEMALFDETADEVAARFAAWGSSGALKRGADGPLSIGRTTDQTYAPAPRVVDTTAAGDSFNGGYIGALLNGQTQADALKAGHDCAAHVVQFRGAIVPEGSSP
ncbi:MAG: sugar kinase [Roseobacter sp.]|jgi:2-dehydro-3-deoxygluconokinase|nr:sugar kinase [Roseobacter sp.]